MDLLVFKVGSGVLVNSDFSLNVERIESIVRQLSEIARSGKSVLLVSSGAVASGRSIAKLRSDSRDAYAAIGQAKLINMYADLFGRENLTVAQVLLLRRNFSERSEFLPLRQTLTDLISDGVIPILNENDPVSDNQLSDNDELAMLLAVSLKASGLYLISDVHGLYEENPNENPDAKLIKVIENLDASYFQKVGQSTSGMGKGGMYNKLKAAKRAMEAGIDTWIVNGTHEDSIVSCVLGGECGTYFKGVDQSESAMKSWLKTGARPTSRVSIDAGAVKALRDRRSLLAVGVRGVEGDFDSKDVIEIVDEENVQVAIGIASIESDELRVALESGETADTIVAHADYISIF